MKSVAGRIRRMMAPFGASQQDIRATLAPAPRSSHFNGHRFRNAQPEQGMTTAGLLALLPAYIAADKSGKKPGQSVPLQRPQFPEPAAELAATWLGHASVLLEIDGYRVLADPMFSDRASPSQQVGPRRLHPIPIRLADLPAVDAVVISHDHYDHLDQATITALAAASSAPFLVPLGVGEHLRAWGVPVGRIVELDWNGHYRLGSLTLTCTPARHFSGRTMARNSTLWSSWTLVGTTRRIFFGGDTGYTSAFAEIGSNYGPFDLTVLPIGAYDSAWPDIHMTPEQAVCAHRDLGGRVLLPIHWATFDLALHSWAEPVERLLAACDGEAAAVVPQPGQRLVIDRLPALQPWWRGRLEPGTSPLELLGGRVTTVDEVVATGDE